VPIVYIDSVHSEDFTDFLYDVSSAGFYSVALFQLIRVVSLSSLQVKNFWVTFKHFEIDTLNEKMRIILALSVLHVEMALLNARNIFDLY